jgi:hypothetical protein
MVEKKREEKGRKEKKEIGKRLRQVVGKTRYGCRSKL